MKGLFVTGTDTGVGKSWVSAWITRSWAADYWKPVQSGTDDGWDENLIGQVAPLATRHPSRYALAAPLSPHAAAALEDIDIRLEHFHLPATERPLVVEGAGGVLVPLNESDLMIDLIDRLGLPVLIVARSGLGTINHSLLTLAALRQRGLEPAGIVLNGPVNPGNRSALEHFGKCRVLAELPPLTALSDLITHPPFPWQPQDFAHG